MSVVAIISTKGGAGKSTLAVHLAVAAALRKRKPILLDFDRKQLSSALWGKGLRARSKKPVIKEGKEKDLFADIAAAGKSHDLVIIDVAAGGGEEVHDIASVAEHILVPVRASAFDMSATRNTMDLLRRAADNTEPEALACRNALGKASIVLNGTPRSRTAKWEREVRQALAESGAKDIPVIGALADRDAYRSTLEQGKGVTEADDDEATEEILALYDALVAIEKERAAKLKRAGYRK